MLNDLRMLASLAAGSILLAAIYGIAVRDQQTSWTYESDGGSASHSVSGDNAEFVSSQEGRTLRAKWRGDLGLTKDALGVGELEHELQITIQEDGEERRITLVNDGGDIKATLERNGEDQPHSAENEADINAAVAEFLTLSGINAEERIAALLRDGGADAAIHAIGELRNDDLVRQYIAELVSADQLETAQLTALASRLEGVSSMESRRRAIVEIVERQSLKEGSALALLDAAAGIDSDHDLRRALEAFAKGSRSDEELAVIASLIGRIGNDHDRRKTAEAFLEGKNLTASQNARLISEAAKALDSDHDIRRLLDDALALDTADVSFQEAWLAGYDHLAGDYDRRKALMNAAEQPDLDRSFARGLIGRAGAIATDTDKRLALASFASSAKADETLLEAYRQAAASISDRTERRLALEAVGL